jgi:preprotein translocase subunit SecE
MAQRGRANDKQVLRAPARQARITFERMTKTLIWVAVVGVIFGVLWWQGQLKRFSVYWQQTMEELKKCTWPTWGELKGSTLVVSISILLLGLLTFVTDQILFALFIKL